MGRPPRSLVARAVAATATVGAVAGLVGASLASVVAYYFLRRDEDARLMVAAHHAQYELDRDRAGESRARLSDLLAVEASEIESAGLSIGVIMADRSRLGSYRGGDVPAGQCADRELDGVHVRACGAVWSDATVIVASTDASVARFRRMCLIAALLAAASSTLLGIMVSRRVARSALSPLTRLHERVVALRPMAEENALGPAEDVLEVDALRSALAALLARQSGALERSRNFAADAAHELRTPLTTLRAKVDILIEQAHLEPEAQRSMASLQAEVTRLARIVDRLLVLAMPEDDVLAAAAPLSVVDLVEELVAGLPMASRERIDFEPTDAATSVVVGDSALLELALANVIDNALKYSSERVAVGVASDHRAVVVEVRDSGPGVPEAERARLFQPFRRGAGARHVRGHGIGLAIVAKVVSAHGGTVDLVGERGLRVRVTLPKADRGRGVSSSQLEV